jgi:hypothetical protein
MDRKLLGAALALAVLSFCAGSAQARWVENGVGVCTELGNQMYPECCSDGAGGFIIAWADSRSMANEHIYAQRIDAFGNALWAADGVRVCSYDSYQQWCRLVPDGAGGAIVAWKDQREGSGIFAQRLGADGSRLWNTNGVEITGGSGIFVQTPPEMISDNRGGAIIAWHDPRLGGADRVYAQRVSASGSVLWADDGLALASGAAGSQEYPKIASDGSYGAFVVWYDSRNLGTSSWDIYVQRIKANGTLMWTNGAAMCSAANVQRDPVIVSTKPGRVFAAWEDYRGGSYCDVYAASMDTTGTMYVWDLAVCTAADEQDWIDLAPDGSEGAILVWGDRRSGFAQHVYAQRATSTGSLLWTANGVRLCTSNYYQQIPIAVPDGTGGAIVVWNDARDGNGDVYCQRIDGTGTVVWPATGTAICAASGAQNNPCAVGDGRNGIFAAWIHGGGSDYDIHAQRIERNGYWGYPCPYIADVADVPHDQGGSVTVSWEGSRLDAFANEIVTHYSIWRSLEAPAAAALVEAGEAGGDPADIPRDFKGPAFRFETIAGTLYGWEWLANMDAHYFDEYTYQAKTYYDSIAGDPATHWFLVSAHTENRFIFWDSPVDSGRSVDNLAPCVPLALSGEQRYDPAGMRLCWAPNGESDLAAYRVYRGTSEDFIPASGNMISSSCDTILFDASWSWSAGYYYKVSAVDVHGNESGFALLRPDDVTGTDEGALPRATALAQNFPNPFNPSTAILFDLAGPGRVTIEVFDVSGRLVARLLDGRREAGRHRVEWRGEDARGSAAPSGVYFCRMRAGSYEATRKIVLMR